MTAAAALVYKAKLHSFIAINWIRSSIMTAATALVSKGESPSIAP